MRKGAIVKVSKFDTKFARLTRNNLQFASFLKYNLPHVNFFDLRDLTLLPDFNFFYFSF
jgi:hypothetical protein